MTVFRKTLVLALLAGTSSLTACLSDVFLGADTLQTDSVSPTDQGHAADADTDVRTDVVTREASVHAADAVVSVDASVDAVDVSVVDAMPRDAALDVPSDRSDVAAIDASVTDVQLDGAPDVADVAVIDAQPDAVTVDVAIDVFDASRDVAVDVGVDGAVDVLPDVPVDPRACPCTAGSYCDLASNRCVPLDCAGERALRVRANAAMTDGNVSIDPDGVGGFGTFVAYCANMSTATPAEYLPLNTATNYTEFNYPGTCPSGCGGPWRARFLRVRLLIDRSGATPAYEALTLDNEIVDEVSGGCVATQCSAVAAARAQMSDALRNWGVAGACTYDYDYATRIDLENTGFVFDADLASRYRNDTSRFDAEQPSNTVDSAYALTIRPAGACGGAYPEQFAQLPVSQSSTTGPTFSSNGRWTDVLRDRMRIRLHRTATPTGLPRPGATCSNPIPLALGPGDWGQGQGGRGRILAVSTGDMPGAPPVDASCRPELDNRVAYFSVDVPANDAVRVIVEHNGMPNPVLRMYDDCSGSCSAVTPSSGTPSGSFLPMMVADNRTGSAARTFVFSASTDGASTGNYFLWIQSTRDDAAACNGLTAATLPVPAAIAPADGAVLASRAVTFNWTLPACVTSGTIEISTNAGFTASLCSSPTCSYDTSSNMTSFTIGIPLAGTYYWRVRPMRDRWDVGNGRTVGNTTSTARSFTVP